MNWLDLILGALFMLCTVGGLILSVVAFKDGDEEAGGMFIVLMIVGGFFFALPFISLDKSSGATIGTITSVDKTFWGNTVVYIKTSETEQEEYCIEDKDVATQAAELIGEKVKVSYGTRVGIYSTGRCNDAPVETIEVVE